MEGRGGMVKIEGKGGNEREGALDGIILTLSLLQRSR